MHKGLGALVVFLLLLGSISGAMAQMSDAQTVDVRLTDQPCGIDIDHTSGTFGTWRWDGTKYAIPTDTQHMIELYSHFLTRPHGGCDVAVSFTGLLGPSGTIAPTAQYFTAYVYQYQDGRPVDPAEWTHPGELGRFYDFHFVLMEVPDNFSPGQYTGTVTITVSNAP